MRSVSACVAIAVGAALAGCTGPGQGEQDASAEIDPRVVDAYFMTSGDSVKSYRWFLERVHELSTEDVRGCLQDKGRPDLVAVHDAQFEDTKDGQFNREFPEPDLLLKHGFIARSVEVPEVSTGDLEILDACSGQPGSSAAAEAETILGNIPREWGVDVMAEVAADPEVTTANEEAMACLVEGGVPPEQADLDRGFFGWVNTRVAARESAGQLDGGLEEAKLFVDCTGTLFDTRERLLLDRRDEFVESHHEQLSRLTELLVGNGDSGP